MHVTTASAILNMLKDKLNKKLILKVELGDTMIKRHAVSSRQPIYSQTCAKATSE